MQFIWCQYCDCVSLCYINGKGPNLLEPACGKGPMEEVVCVSYELR